jgi:hypothetical protein
MTETNKGLRQLHRIHLALREVRDQLARGPKQVQARRQLVEKARAEVDSLRAQLKEARANADRKSLDLRSKEAKLVELQAKLNMASSNREFDIIRGQLEADKVAKSVLEDEILEALETVDRLQVAIGEAEGRVRQAEAEQVRAAAEVAAAEPGLRAQADSLDQQLRDTEVVLAGETAQRYRRLVEAHGADALAAVDGTVCTNCYVSLTPQSRVALSQGKIIFCNCGRLLYLLTSSGES